MQSFQITRRCLPHWQQPGSIYFITWRVKNGETLAPEEREITLAALRHWDSSKWTLLAGAVLSDHVHALAQPLPHPEGGFYNLSELMHSIKRHSARVINQLRGKQGPLWQDERYDRIVRDENEFLEKWNYIRNNPVRLGLSDRPEDYPWLYEKDGPDTG